MNNDKNNINNEQKDDNAKEELIEQFNIIDLSLNTIYVILVAVLINVRYLIVLRQELLDQIEDTDFSKDMEDVKYYPKVSNMLFLYATGIFLTINMYQYVKIAEETKGICYSKERRKARKAFISSFLIYIATCISRSNIEV